MPRNRTLFVIFGLVLAACNAPAEPISTEVAPSTSATGTIAATPARSTPEPSIATSTAPDTTLAPISTPALRLDHYSATFDSGRDLVDLYLPDDASAAPVLVLVHGGAWITGDASYIAPLANELAARGVIVFNVSYHTLNEGGAFPSMVDDVACAVAFATAKASEYTASKTVVIAGHSAGGHLAALVAFSKGRFGADCPWDPSAGVDGFIGLAGLYDVATLPILAAFFGAALEDDPELWASGNPLTYVESNAGITTLAIHGSADEVVPLAESLNLVQLVNEFAGSARLERVDGENHNGMVQPVVVNDLILEFMDEIKNR